MAEDHSYNGWANYETWVVSLWLGNDQGTDSAVRELVADAMADDDVAPKSAAANALQDWVEETFIDPLFEEHAGLATDLLRGALSDVDWFEVAAAFAPETES